MAILDTLSGYAFEEVMADVFRKRGYEEVRLAAHTADAGRDILMREDHGDRTRAVVVECKHTATVGRPVVQKLHSAVATYPFEGPRRGIVVTSGRFTGPARTYAASLEDSGDPHPIALIDGRALREIAAEVGLDLRNGRIEILDAPMLAPPAPGPIAARVDAAIDAIAGLDAATVERIDPQVRLRPVVAVAAHTEAVFETSVGVIHRVDATSQLVLDARPAETAALDPAVASVVTAARDDTVAIDAGTTVAGVRCAPPRFGDTETHYKEWAIERLRAYHTSTVRYTGDNNVTYTKECVPRAADVHVRSVEPLVLPEVTHGVTTQEYTHTLTLGASGTQQAVVADRIRRCVHCDTAGAEGSYTACPNCGAIACADHIREERLSGGVVCTGCAVSGRFMLQTNHFYSEADLARFRTAYAAMPPHRRLAENRLLAAGSVVAIIIIILMLIALWV